MSPSSSGFSEAASEAGQAPITKAQVDALFDPVPLVRPHCPSDNRFHQLFQTNSQGVLPLLSREQFAGAMVSALQGATKAGRQAFPLLADYENEREDLKGLADFALENHFAHFDSVSSSKTRRGMKSESVLLLARDWADRPDLIDRTRKAAAKGDFFFETARGRDSLNRPYDFGLFHDRYFYVHGAFAKAWSVTSAEDVLNALYTDRENVAKYREKEIPLLMDMAAKLLAQDPSLELPYKYLVQLQESWEKNLKRAATAPDRPDTSARALLARATDAVVRAVKWPVGGPA